MESSVKADSTDGESALWRQRRQFEEFCDNTRASRALSEKCRDYYDGKQWTDTEEKTLKKRGQPCITDNKIRDKVDTLLGMEKQMRTDPKAYPRTEKEEEAAEAATDALRFVAETCFYQRTARAPASANLAIEGLCVGLVNVEKPKGGKYPKVSMEHVRWDRSYYDVHSLRPDFEDKSYCGFFTWRDVPALEKQYPEKVDALSESFGSNTSSGIGDKTQEDKPRYTITSGNRRRVQVFKHYELIGGVWNESLWVKGGFLEEPKPCQYKNEDNEPSCPMEFQALYRDSEGDPYGMVQRYLDLQDEHNKRHSKMLHLLNAKRTVYQKGVLDNPNETRNEIHKPDGMIGVEGDIAQFRIEDNLNAAEGQWKLLQYTDTQLAATGPNAALSGQSGDLSGRAKQLDQASGTLLVSPMFDALESWEIRMYRQAWCRVRQYWTSEIWIRVTDEDKFKFVALNQKMTKGDQAAKMLAQEQVDPAQKAQAVQTIAQHPDAQQPALDEQGKPIIKNSVAEMDVDIIIDRAPGDVVNIQQEQFEILAELAKSQPGLIPPDALIEASSLRSDVKRKIRDKMSGNDPASQQMAQLQQQMQQLQMALQAANVAKTQAQAEQASAAAAESHIDAAVKVATFTSPDPNNPDGKPAGKTQVSVN